MLVAVDISSDTRPALKVAIQHMAVHTSMSITLIIARLHPVNDKPTTKVTLRVMKSYRHTSQTRPELGSDSNGCEQPD